MLVHLLDDTGMVTDALLAGRHLINRVAIHPDTSWAEQRSCARNKEPGEPHPARCRHRTSS